MTRDISRSVCACLLSLAAAGQVHDAAAQTDLNVQTRIDEATPRFADRIPSVGEPRIERRLERRLKPPAEIDALIGELPRFRALNVPVSRLLPEQRREWIRQLGDRAYTRIAVERRVPPQRRVAADLSVSIGPAHDSNIDRGSAFHRSDATGSFGLAGRVAIPVGKRFDQVVLSASATAVRHARSAGHDFDTVHASAAYEAVELAFDPQHYSTKTATGRILRLAVSGSTSFERGFGDRSIAFVTPSVALSRTNLPLSDRICRDASGHAGYCHYADVTARFGGSWSELPSAQNLHASLWGSVGWRVPDTDLSVALAAEVSGRTYFHFTGGRDDLTLSVGPRVDVAISRSVSASLSLRRIEQHSSIAAAGYHAYVASAHFNFALGNPWNRR